MRFDIETISEANSRDNWRYKNRRKNAQQKAFLVLWRNAKIKVVLPAEITFIRYSHKTLDDDNIRSAFKGLRDQLAKELKIDDGSELVKWSYAQVKTPKRENYFEIKIL